MFSRKTWKVARHCLYDLVGAYEAHPSEKKLHLIRSMAGEGSPGAPGFKVSISHDGLHFSRKN